MNTINAAELATWTPVALNLDMPTPSVDWGNFGDLRFTEPFFDQTVAQWAARNPAPRMVRTDLDALVTLDQAPSLNPDGMIFHMSRCGSTLLARLLRQIPGCVVISEPEIINGLLCADCEIIEQEVQVQLLRLLIRALGRRRFGDECKYILKLSSWNIRKLGLFRQAFPDTPIVWLQRTPAEVLASLLARRPTWHQGRPDNALIGSFFGMEAEEVAQSESKALYCRALGAVLNAAVGTAEGVMETIEYTDLPEVAWTKVASLFGLSIGELDIVKMKEEARYYSKEAKPRVFNKGDALSVGEEIRILAAEQLDPLYFKLTGRRASKPGLRQSVVLPE